MSSVVENLRLEQIRIDGETQSRAEINNEVVAEYAEALTEGEKFPPVIVFFDGASYWLADGFHRRHAHEKIGALDIAAEVRDGTQLAARIFSHGANKSHGLRRTNADKKKAVLGMLRDAPEWSDNRIAKHVGVHHSTVGEHRRSLANSASDEPQPRTYTTKHGTAAVMNTANIGGARPAPYQGKPKTGPKADAMRAELKAAMDPLVPPEDVETEADSVDPLADAKPDKKITDLASELSCRLNPDSFPVGEEHDALVELHVTLGKMFGDELEMQVDALTRECDRLTAENKRLQLVAGSDLGKKLIAAHEKVLAVEVVRNRLMQQVADLKQENEGLKAQMRRARRDS